MPLPQTYTPKVNDVIVTVPQNQTVSDVGITSGLTLAAIVTPVNMSKNTTLGFLGRIPGTANDFVIMTSGDGREFTGKGDPNTYVALSKFDFSGVDAVKLVIDRINDTEDMKFVLSVTTGG